MDITMFLILLSGFAALTSLIVEGVKNFTADQENLPYNVLTLIVALIVGGGGTAVYYQLNMIPFTADNIIYMALMGLASGLCSMVGFDKTRQAIEQIINRKS